MALLEQTKRHLTPKDAATYCSLSVSLLAKLRMKREGPTYLKIGKAIRYTAADLDAWMESRRVVTAAPRAAVRR